MATASGWSLAGKVSWVGIQPDAVQCCAVGVACEQLDRFDDREELEQGPIGAAHLPGDLVDQEQGADGPPALGLANPEHHHQGAGGGGDGIAVHAGGEGQVRLAMHGEEGYAFDPEGA